MERRQAALGQNFVESWTYSACLTLVAECEARVEQDVTIMVGDPTTSFVAVKAELLEMAKKQVRLAPSPAQPSPPVSRACAQS